MAASAEFNQDEVEPLVSEVLRLLGSCRREGVQVVVALATTGLQGLKDAQGSKHALQTIQYSAAAVLASELQDSDYSFTLDNATSAQFWCSCYRLSAEVTDHDLLPPITALRALSERCTHLTLLFLRVASSVLTREETVQFLQHLCKMFWRQEIGQLAQKLEVNESSGSFSDLNQSWQTCIKNLVFVYIVQSMHDSLCCSMANTYLPTQSEGKGDVGAAVCAWLCSDILSPVLSSLVISAPLLAHSAHQQWWKDDQERLGRLNSVDLPVMCLKKGKVFKSCALLTDALSLLAMVAAGSPDKTLRMKFTETILRLGHHYWEQLAQVVKEVPQRLPMKVWYLVMSSSLHLHSHLSTFHPTLETNSSEKEHFPQLLHTLSEFCDGLRGNIVSYHSELLVASLLHDSGSHDWQNTKSFFESERCSFSVQMWRYHLQGLKHDLWTICPGLLATSILASVLARTVSHLASRYTAVRPSYRRVAQYRADILAILVSSASLLPCISPPLTPLTVSAEVTTIHRSCAVLLASLAVVGCRLEQLQASLVQLNEASSDDLNVDQLWQWMEHLSLDHFGLVRHSSTAGTVLSDFTVLVCLPYPKWELLLKLLLARDGVLATALCCSTTSKGDTLLPHVALIVAHCYHKPRALSNLFTALENNCSSIAPGNVQPELKPCLKWLADLLKDELQRCVMSGATKFCSTLKEHGTMHRTSPDVAECLVAVVGRLESCLYQLPQPVVNLLCDLANGGMSPTVAQTPDFSIRLAKVLCVLMGSWLGPSFLPSSSLLGCGPLLSLMATYCTVLKHILQGTLTEGGHHPELTSLSPELVRLLEQKSPVLQERVRRFASSLHWTPPEDEGPSVCTDAEFEVVAEILAGDSRVLHSLELLYSTLKANKTSITQALCTPSSPSLPTVLEGPHESDFNPLTVCTSLGGGTFDHQKLLNTELDWRVVLDSFALRMLGRRGVTVLVGNRPEFQEGAQLQGREPEFVEAIRASLQ